VPVFLRRSVLCIRAAYFFRIAKKRLVKQWKPKPLSSLDNGVMVVLLVAELLSTKDVAIIGAGPVGLFSVFALGMVGLESCIMDGLDVAGGKCALLYPEKPIYDIPAIPSISGAGLIESLKEQIAPFNPEYLLSRKVIGLVHQPDQNRFFLTLHTGEQVCARAVIISAGAGAFTPNRPSIDGIEVFEGKSILYAVTNTALFAGKKVVIAGGGDSALDWALLLKDIAAQVVLVHRRTTFRAHEATQRPLREAIDCGSIILKAPFQLDGVEGEGDQLHTVYLKDFDGNKEKLEADYLLPFFGIATNLGAIAEWGPAMQARHILVDPTTAQTSVEGVYAVGDVSTYPNKRKLIAVGFSEAMYAAQSIYKFLNPDKEFRFGYSTNTGVPGNQ